MIYQEEESEDSEEEIIIVRPKKSTMTKLKKKKITYQDEESEEEEEPPKSVPQHVQRNAQEQMKNDLHTDHKDSCCAQGRLARLLLLLTRTHSTTSRITTT
jgi:hypothetical protein